MTGRHDERIARGMALLDEKVPGWERRIDLERLELSNCLECVVGQLFVGDPELLVDQAFRRLPADPDDDQEPFVEGLHRLGLGTANESDYGFSLPARETSWELLTDAWRRAIRERLDGGL